MKKTIKFYAICWAVLLVVFNVICFVTPNEVAEYEKFGGAFWAGYVCITAAFIGQFVCAYFALKAENLQKLFYNMPLITVSYTGLILTLIFGSICMAIPNLPNWVGIILCLFILGLNAVAVFKSASASDLVEDIDKKIKVKTAFVKMTTVDAEDLLNRAQDPEIKANLQKVYETIRYSDPMSNDALLSVETKITEQIEKLGDAVKAGNADAVKSISDKIVALIKNRNAKCKALK